MRNSPNVMRNDLEVMQGSLAIMKTTLYIIGIIPVQIPPNHELKRVFAEKRAVFLWLYKKLALPLHSILEGQ